MSSGSSGPLERRLVVVGSANLDIVNRVERIPKTGETVLAVGTSRNSGGKGANQAIAAARGGGSVVFVAALGDDAEALQIVADLNGADVASMIRRVQGPTGAAYITVDSEGRNTIVVASGANATMTALLGPEREMIERSSHLLLQLESPLPLVIDAARVAHSAGAVVILNAAPIRSIPAELLDLVDILVVNEHEAAELARELEIEVLLDSSSAVRWASRLARELIARVDCVAITLGESGSVLYGPGMSEPTAVRSFPTNPIDTTGAGDTFCGALAASLMAGTPLVESARFASAAASLSVRTAGAIPSIPRESEIRELLASMPAGR